MIFLCLSPHKKIKRNLDQALGRYRWIDGHTITRFLLYGEVKLRNSTLLFFHLSAVFKTCVWHFLCHKNFQKNCFCSKRKANVKYKAKSKKKEKNRYKRTNKKTGQKGSRQTNRQIDRQINRRAKSKRKVAQTLQNLLVGVNPFGGARGGRVKWRVRGGSGEGSTEGPIQRDGRKVAAI